MGKKTEKRNPWAIVPTLYFIEGLPYILVNNLAVVMLKSLDVSNELIGYLTLLSLPWSVKPLWGPYLDSKSTKRNWVLSMGFILTVLFILLAVSLSISPLLYIIIAFLVLIAFTSATHDIAIDGFYLHALDKKDQAFFTGIRSTFYRFAMIFGGGILVTIAGGLGDSFGNIALGWSFAFYIAGAIFLLIFLFHRFILPHPKTDVEVKSADNKNPFFESFAEYFKKDKIVVILLFILSYRLGEGILVRMAQPFLLDPAAKGGMGISVSEVGFMYGTMGAVALVIGGILGGILVKKYSLKKLLFPMALFMNIPNLLYVYLSYAMPGYTWSLDLSFISGDWSVSLYLVVQACIIVEQFGYGLGFTAFMVYLLYISTGKFKTSHYAISTGFMAVGMLIPGFFSGLLQESVGYFWLFLISSLATIPGMIIIFFLPEYEDVNG